MSLDIDSAEHTESVEELLEENTKWLKVISILLGQMQGSDPFEIYEDLE